MVGETTPTLDGGAGADDHLPLILIHRDQSVEQFYNQLTDLLRRHFRLLDPIASSSSPPLSLDAFITLHAPPPSTVRALVVLDLHPLTAETLRLLPSSLELVVGTTAGTNHIDVGSCHRSGIVVTGAGDAFTDATAEHAVGILVDVLRRVSAADRYVRDGLWLHGVEYALGSKDVAKPSEGHPDDDGATSAFVRPKVDLRLSPKFSLRCRLNFPFTPMMSFVPS